MVYSTRGVVECLIKHEAKPSALSDTRPLPECCKPRSARPQAHINWLIVTTLHLVAMNAHCGLWFGCHAFPMLLLLADLIGHSIHDVTMQHSIFRWLLCVSNAAFKSALSLVSLFDLN